MVQYNPKEDPTVPPAIFCTRPVTSLGKTQVWGLTIGENPTQTLVIFPGARTTSLIWDIDCGLYNLQCNLRIFMVETNGLPNLSDGATPDIHSLDYGTWAKEVFNQCITTWCHHQADRKECAYFSPIILFLSPLRSCWSTTSRLLLSAISTKHRSLIS